uniref:Protein Nef n=1 Tax=Human immunodeficiency virus type 1 TaxID=11676 RepID=E2DI66_HV1|nr:nef protein [Human immunodeficiency virus 1]
MGGKWSKCSIVGWPEIRERIRRTPARTPTPPAAVGVGAVSQDLARHGAITSSNTAATNPDCAWVEAQSEDSEVGFPVRPQVPLRPMTYKAAFDLSFFLKEKGGLDGLVYSKQRRDQNYPPGPGTRFPLTYGWCFKLVPMDPAEVEEAATGENNSLL